MTVTTQDSAIIDRLTTPPAPPERIHHWMNSQLSIARFYGGCTYQNARYVINYDEPGNPLVRADVFAAEHKAKRDANRAALRAMAAKAKMDQGGLL